MLVLVTGDTGTPQRYELSIRESSIRHMAFPARLPAMGALERELGLVVVKVVVPPGSRPVTGFTSFSRVIPGRNLILVDVFMTTHTTNVKISECPPLFLHMAGKTRGRLMGALQRKIGAGMSLNGKQTTLESFNCMAFPAIRSLAFSLKFAFVVILMT